MKKISDRILSWCDSPEESAIQQAKNIADHPFLIGNVCLMPDCHTGYGMPIGGVVALDRAVCPNMVGVDIGCGMLAMKTNITEKPSKALVEKVINDIYETVPVGFQWHSKKQDYTPVFRTHLPVASGQIDSLPYYMGTLGGGNHFIELQWGDDNHLWFMIHTGSRNLGKKVAEHYNKIAEELCHRWHYDSLIANDLSVIPAGEDAFSAYWSEMQFCLDFASENRRRISSAVMYCIQKHIPSLIGEQLFTIHHNYCAIEHHYGKNVYVHRKGATLARSGTVGVIPGSQGTASYIVRGLGKEASMHSCSHGAGRCMSRKKAKETLSIEKEAAFMDSNNIVHRINSVESLEESASAYKDIDTVMEQQKDLVEISVKLQPLGVVKG